MEAANEGPPLPRSPLVQRPRPALAIGRRNAPRLSFYDWQGEYLIFDRSLLCVFFIAEPERAPRVLFSRRLIFAFLLIGDFLRRVFFTAARAHLHESLKHERDRVF